MSADPVRLKLATSRDPQDGYSGGSYSACADVSQPGVGSVVSYLGALKKPVSPNCEDKHYYLLNNYNPGYFGNGTVGPHWR
ncbi:MAG: hypothetical protein ACJ8AW_45810 [Rhodopila sp.]